MDGVRALQDRAEEHATGFLAEDIFLAEIHEPAHPAGRMMGAVGPCRSVVGVPLEQCGDIVMKSILVATAGADRDERAVMRILADHHRRWNMFDPIDVSGMTDVLVIPRQERRVQQTLHADHIPDDARHAPEDPLVFCNVQWRKASIRYHEAVYDGKRKKNKDILMDHVFFFFVHYGFENQFQMDFRNNTSRTLSSFL